MPLVQIDLPRPLFAEKGTQNVEWIAGVIQYMRAHGLDVPGIC